MDQYMPKCYECDTYNLPYECDSVMHYGWMDFAASGRLLAFFRPTMTAKHPSCHLTSDGGKKRALNRVYTWIFGHEEVGRKQKTHWRLENNIC